VTINQSKLNVTRHQNRAQIKGFYNILNKEIESFLGWYPICLRQPNREENKKNRLANKSPVYTQCLKNFKTSTIWTDVGKKEKVYLLSSSCVLVMNTVCSSNHDSHQSHIPFLHTAVTKLGPVRAIYWSLLYQVYITAVIICYRQDLRPCIVSSQGSARSSLSRVSHHDSRWLKKWNFTYHTPRHAMLRFFNSLTLEDGTDRLFINVDNYHFPQRNIPEGQRSMWTTSECFKIYMLCLWREIMVDRVKWRYSAHNAFLVVKYNPLQEWTNTGILIFEKVGSNIITACFLITSHATSRKHRITGKFTVYTRIVTLSTELASCTLLVPRPWKWLRDFWKISGPLLHVMKSGMMCWTLEITLLPSIYFSVVGT
jgi:hypothetical protein